MVERRGARHAVGLALRATRPQYIPTSLLAGVIGLTVAADAGGADWWLAPVALVALFAVHAGTNVINDVEDFARGVDDEHKLDNSRVFTTRLMSVPAGRRLALAAFGAAFVLGVAIAVVQGPALLAIGIAGLLVGYGYSAGPAPLKYAGLGDVTIVLVMGPLITQGAYTAVTGDGFDASAFWIGFAPGFLITGVLAANNLSDIDGDRAAGVRTLAVRLGFGPARALYVATLVLGFATPVAVFAAGLYDWPVLLALLTAPAALKLTGKARKADARDHAVLLTAAPETAQLHLLFCVLLATGILIDRA